jgi:transcription antitermination factor NusG
VSDRAELSEAQRRSEFRLSDMQNATFDNSETTIGANLPTEYLEQRWYAAYTCANHEKRVAEQFGVRSVEYFLPLYESVRRWKDRRMRLQLPLFPGYVFVRLALRDRLQVLQVPGVAKLVGFNGTPAALPQEEIETLRLSLEGGVHAEPHPYLAIGRRVRVKAGSLAGLEGILVRRKKRARFVISLDLIQRSVAVEVDGSEVEPMGKEVAAVTCLRRQGKERRGREDEGLPTPGVLREERGSEASTGVR